MGRVTRSLKADMGRGGVRQNNHMIDEAEQKRERTDN